MTQEIGWLSRRLWFYGQTCTPQPTHHTWARLPAYSKYKTKMSLLVFFFFNYVPCQTFIIWLIRPHQIHVLIAFIWIGCWFNFNKLVVSKLWFNSFYPKKKKKFIFNIDFIGTWNLHIIFFFLNGTYTLLRNTYPTHKIFSYQ